MTINQICNFSNFGNMKKSVYKLLDEYSAGGREINGVCTDKTDTDLKIVQALNFSVSKALEDFPSVCDTKSLYFPKIHSQLILSSLSFNTSAQEKMTLAVKSDTFAIGANVCGKGSIEIVGANTGKMLCQRFFETATESQFESLFVTAKTDEDTSVCIYIKSNGFLKCSALYAYFGDITSEIENARPLYNMTFCKAPENFGKITKALCDGREIREHEFLVLGGYIYVNYRICGCVDVEYEVKMPFFDENTPDDETVYLAPKTFEAAVTLCAIELCSSYDTNLYNRLMYKYNDLALNCYDKKADLKVKNSFFGGVMRKLCGGKR